MAEEPQDTKTVRFIQSAIRDRAYEVGEIEDFPVEVADAIIAEGNAVEHDPADLGERLLEVSESEAVADLQRRLALAEAERDGEREARERAEATVAELQAADPSSASPSDPSPADPADPVTIPDQLPDDRDELVALAEALGLPTKAGNRNLSAAKLAEAIEAKRAELDA